MAIATDLYSHNGGTPDFLPTDATGTHWIRMSDGFVRTDITSFSDDDLADAGYTGPYPKPSMTAGQNCTWNSGSKTWTVVDKDIDVAWEELRDERNMLLGQSDWTQLGDVSGAGGSFTGGNSGLTTSKKAEWTTYRQELRDLPGITTDPRLTITWPSAPSA